MYIHMVYNCSPSKPPNKKSCIPPGSRDTRGTSAVPWIRGSMVITHLSHLHGRWYQEWWPNKCTSWFWCWYSPWFDSLVWDTLSLYLYIYICVCVCVHLSIYVFIYIQLSIYHVIYFLLLLVIVSYCCLLLFIVIYSYSLLFIIFIYCLFRYV